MFKRKRMKPQSECTGILDYMAPCTCGNRDFNPEGYIVYHLVTSDCVMIKVPTQVKEKLMSKILKHTLVEARPQSGVVRGNPRTIGVDAYGHLCLWFESAEEYERPFCILWTGNDIPQGYRVIDSCMYIGLVIHLAVPALNDAIVNHLAVPALNDAIVNL